MGNINMSNIQTIQINIKPEDLQNIFNNHNIVAEHPLDYNKFVKDIINSVIMVTTTVYPQTIDTNYTFNN